MNVKISLTEVWQQNYIPKEGDQLQVYCKDMDEFAVQVSILEVSPARYKEGEGNLYSWYRNDGKISGDIYFNKSVSHYKYLPKRGDYVKFHAVECLPSDSNLNCIWRATNVTPLDHIGGYGGNSNTYQKRLGCSWMPSSDLNISCMKNKFVIRGEGPLKPLYGKQKWINRTLDKYDVPPMLCEISEQADYIDQLHKYYPCVGQVLTNTNYMDKFKTLLYIEELESSRQLTSYSMENIFLRSCGQFLILDLPGLKESRPSLVLGDSVMLLNPRNLDGPVYEGCIQNVGKLELVLKFSESFHTAYLGEAYHVFFKMNRTQIRRQHRAIVSAVENLGVDILFPRNVTMKPPQVLFNIEEENKFEPTLTNGKTLLISKKRRNMNASPPQVPQTTNDSQKWSLLPVNKLECWVTPVNEEQIIIARKLFSLTKVNSLPYHFRFESSLPAYPPLDLARHQTKSLKWVNKNLNPEQKTAVKRILSGEGRPFPYVIYGPPGTGKTLTVVESVLQIFLLHSDARILIATPSNSSADLVALRLINTKRIKKGELARLNAFQRIEDNIPESVKPYSFVCDGDSLLKAAMCNIVVSTCGTIGAIFNLKLQYGHFTHVFIDEAGQLTEPQSMIPLCLVNKDVGQIVLAGDPQQLGPVLQSPLASVYGLEQSYLERISKLPVYLSDNGRFLDHCGYDPILLTKLVRNYRSHSDILKVPSMLYYDNELIACASKIICDKFLGSDLLPNKDHPIIFHGIVGECKQEADSPSWFNPQEVWQVCVYVKSLIEDEHIKPEEIGIVAPYRKQVSKIRECLKNTFLIEGIKVGSVEEFQGQEMAVIILTTTRSNNTNINSDVAQGIGFLTSPKRMNVAVTRAQSLLILIGNPHVLAEDENWKVMIEYILSLGAYTGCSPPSL